MRIASIDIGTNTILLLIAEVTKKGERLYLESIFQKQYIPRIGRNTDSSGLIQEKAFSDCEQILNEYKIFAEKYDCQNIIATGTSALRDANNKDEFIKHQFNKTGIRISILSGEEEAQCTFKGALTNIFDDNKYCVIDIGGGSTEISHGTNNELQFHKSINIGAVRVTERFFTKLPISDNSFKDAISFIHENINILSENNFSDSKFIAVAGTATTLAKIDLKLSQFNYELIENYKLKLESINNSINHLKTLTLSEIEAIPYITKGRSDVILAGALILKQILTFLSVDVVNVSTKGLRFGTSLREANKLFFNSLDN